MSDEASFEQVERDLARYGALTRAAIDRHLPEVDGSYLWDLVRDYPARDGKGIRPGLLLATCEAFGGTVEEAIGSAAAIEMLHNAFLVHDDIQDGSRQRRGAPTLHEKHGVALAINAGDALALLAMEPLRHQTALGSRLGQRVMDEFNTMAMHTAEGQALELGWRRDNVIDLGPDDYLELIMKKTCWYTTICPLRVGAIIGSRGTARLAPLNEFGFYLGAAFQIRDDLLNLVGSEAHYGKEIGGDLREGKRTLMLLHLAGAVTGAERGRLLAYLEADETARTPDAMASIRSLMDHHGSIDFAIEYAQGIASAAYRAFDAAFGGVSPSPATAFVRGMVPYMLARTS